MKSIFVIVVKNNANKFLPEWLPGSPVVRNDSTFSGAPSFNLAWGTNIQAYDKRKSAEIALADRKGNLREIEFEIVEFKAA